MSTEPCSWLPKKSIDELIEMFFALTALGYTEIAGDIENEMNRRGFYFVPRNPKGHCGSGTFEKKEAL